jgi:hypothetical protein
MVTYFNYGCACCGKSHLLCLRDETAASPSKIYVYECPESGAPTRISGLKLVEGRLDDVECPRDSLLLRPAA